VAADARLQCVRRGARARHRALTPLHRHLRAAPARRRGGRHGPHGRRLSHVAVDLARHSAAQGPCAAVSLLRE
jgi:hypothetical protein